MSSLGTTILVFERPASRVRGWVLVASLALASVGCNSSTKAGDADGPHGVRISEYPWVSYTAGSQDRLRIVDVSLDDGCAMTVYWGATGALEQSPGHCSESELARGRGLFSDEMVLIYTDNALSLDDPNPSDEPRTRVVIDSGKGESPKGLLVPAAGSSSSAQVNEMLSFFEVLFGTYAPASP
jgi:hypothetical protein